MTVAVQCGRGGCTRQNACNSARRLAVCKRPVQAASKQAWIAQRRTLRSMEQGRWAGGKLRGAGAPSALPAELPVVVMAASMAAAASSAAAVPGSNADCQRRSTTDVGLDWKPTTRTGELPVQGSASGGCGGLSGCCGAVAGVGGVPCCFWTKEEAKGDTKSAMAARWAVLGGLAPSLGLTPVAGAEGVGVGGSGSQLLQGAVAGSRAGSRPACSTQASVASCWREGKRGSGRGCSASGTVSGVGRRAAGVDRQQSVRPASERARGGGKPAGRREDRILWLGCDRTGAAPHPSRRHASACARHGGG